MHTTWRGSLKGSVAMMLKAAGDFSANSRIADRFCVRKKMEMATQPEDIKIPKREKGTILYQNQAFYRF